MALSIVNVGYPLAPVGPNTVGGAEQIVCALDRALARAGHHSTVVAPQGSELAGELLPLPTAAEPFDEERQRSAQVAVRTALAALERVPDVLHFHGVDFLEYLPSTSSPVVVTCHLPLSYYPLERFTTLEGAVEFVAVSYAQAATARGFGFGEIIPNGVDIDFFTPAGERGNYVLALGRVCREKGFHHAVAAAKRAKLALVLGGRVYPYPAHQAYFAAELEPSLDAERRFIGAVAGDDKRRLLCQARCLIVPSLAEETCSLVALEALACGTPVVGLRRGALAEVVEHGETGLLVDDPEELGDALLEIGAIDPSRCRRAAVERFASARMTRAYLDLYARLASPAPRNRSHAVAAPSFLAGEPAPNWRSIRALGELSRLAPAWRELWGRCPLASVFSRPEWLLPWLRAFTPERVAVLVAERGQQLEALVPLCIPEGSSGPWQLVGVGLSDYGEVLAASPELLAEALERARAQSQPEGLVLDDLPCDSALVDGVARRGGRVVAENVCPALELPPGDPFGAVPAELRNRIARDRRRAAREGLRLETVDQRSLAEVLRYLFTFGAHRFAGAPSFFSDPRARAFQLEVATRLYAAGSLRLHALRRGRECLGALYGFRCGARLLSYQHAFAADISSLSPGILLTAHAIEAAGGEGCTTFDFLRGRESYKYRWGARDRAIVSLAVGHEGSSSAVLAS